MDENVQNRVFLIILKHDFFQEKMFLRLEKLQMEGNVS